MTAHVHTEPAAPASASFPNSRRVHIGSPFRSIQCESEHRIACYGEQILMSIEHVRFGRIRLIADARMPQGLSGGRVKSHKVGSTAGKNQFSRSGQQSGGASSWKLMSPGHVTGPVIN